MSAVRVSASLVSAVRGSAARNGAAQHVAARAVIAVLVGVLGGGLLAGCSNGLPDQGTVSGTVRSGAGEPMAGCAVTRAARGDTPYPVSEEAAATDDEGSFSWDMYPGLWVLTVSCPASRELRGISAVVDVRSDQTQQVSIVVR